MRAFGRSIFARVGRIGPLALPLVLMVLLLLGWSGMRMILAALYWARIHQTESFQLLFPIGLRIDLTSVCYVGILPCLAVLAVPRPAAVFSRLLLLTYLTTITTLALFFEIATVPFMAEFDTRPNRLFFENLASVKEITGMLLGAYRLPLVLAILLLLAGIWLSWQVFAATLDGLAHWPAGRRLAFGLPAVLVLLLGARGTLSHRPLNISMASFSDNQLVNQLALNSLYSAAYSLYGLSNEIDAGRLYGTMLPAEILSIVRREAGISVAEPIDPQSPLLHRQVPRTPAERKTNVVIVLEESLGAEYVGCLGGLPLTPNLDRLSREGTLLTRLYATGTRTARGIEAVVSGFPPSPGLSVVKLALSQDHFFTLAELFASYGYATEFIYGGESHFDDMRSFFMGNGFHKIFDEPAFADARFRGTWGVSDEDLFDKADEIFVDHGDQPFFAVILSTSNHTPFEFPAGAIELYEQPQNTRNNAMKYADHALGRFIDRARQSGYYERTLFVLVADHNTRTYGNDLVPVNKFHIPGLILGPGVPELRYDRVASQLDLGPTILDLIGLEAEHPMLGRSIFSRAEDDPGRAIMQFDSSHAYMQGDQVVVHLPRHAPSQFTYRDGRLVPATLVPALERIALAHALLPGLLYEGRLYRGRTPTTGD